MSNESPTVTYTVYDTRNGACGPMRDGFAADILSTLQDHEALLEGNHLGKRIDLATGEPVDLLQFADVITLTNNTIAGLWPGTQIDCDYVRGVAYQQGDDGDETTFTVGVNYDTTQTIRLSHRCFEETIVQLNCTVADSPESPDLVVTMEYGDLRRRAYAPIGDSVDAVLKAVEALALDGFEFEPEVQAVILDWRAVKDAIPKIPPGG